MEPGSGNSGNETVPSFREHSMPGLGPGSITCKANTLLPILSFWPHILVFKQSRKLKVGGRKSAFIKMKGLLLKKKETKKTQTR